MPGTKKLGITVPSLGRVSGCVERFDVRVVSVDFHEDAPGVGLVAPRPE